MSTSARATAIFDADDGKLQAVAKSVEHRLSELKESFGALKETMIGLFIAEKIPELFHSIGEGIQGVLETGTRFHDLSADTGAAVDDLVVLEEQFRRSGKSVDDLAGPLAKMEQNLANGSASNAIGQLGLNMEELRSKTPVEAFEMLGESIAAVKNPMDRLALSTEIFGKAGRSLASVFETSFSSAAASVGTQAEILGRNAALFHDASISLGTAGVQMRGFFVGLSDQVVPGIMAVGYGLEHTFAALNKHAQEGLEAIGLPKIDFTDFTKMGQEIGHILTTAAIALPNAGRILGDTMQLGVLGFLTLLEDGFLTVGHNFLGLLDEGVADIADKLGKVPGLGAASGAGASLHSAAASEMGIKHGGTYDSSIAALWGDMQSKVKEASTAADVIQAAMEAAHPQRTEGGDPELGNLAPHVSHLASIGGAYGQIAAGGDPMSDIGRKLDDHRSLLQQIATNTAKGPNRAPLHPGGD